MDAELQKSIREFNPADVATHGLWYRLARVHPLHEVLDSVPLAEMTAGQLLQHSGKVMAEIGKKIKAIKPLRLKHGIYREAHPIVSIEHDTATPTLFQRLSELFTKCGQELREEFTPQIATHFRVNCDYYGGDHDFQDLEMGFNIYNTREETPDEEAVRLEKETAAKEVTKKAKQERAKQQKLEKERLELAEYKRLRKKFGEQ
jgi:hypothetical protein